jgi:DNA replication protein DnaC
MADAAQRFAGWFCHRRPDRPRLMALVGQRGCGKTHCAEKLYRFASSASVTLYRDLLLWPHPPRIEFVEWASICFLDSTAFREWLNGQEGTDLIFIEDLGCELDRFKSKEPTERLREVLNLMKNRYVFATTNVPPERWASVWDLRVADRLMRNSQVVELKGLGSYAAR